MTNKPSIRDVIEKANAKKLVDRLKRNSSALKSGMTVPRRREFEETYAYKVEASTWRAVLHGLEALADREKKIEEATKILYKMKLRIEFDDARILGEQGIIWQSIDRVLALLGDEKDVKIMAERKGRGEPK